MAQQIYQDGEQVLFRIKKCSLLDISVPLLPIEDSDDMTEAACLFCNVCDKVIHFSNKGSYIDFDKEGYICAKCEET